MKASSCFALLLSLLAFAACTEYPVCHAYHTLPADGWSSADSIVFETDSLQEDGHYAIQVLLRTSAAKPYPYRQLWIEVSQQWDTLQSAALDTLVCTFATDKGKPTGKGVLHYQHAFPLGTLSLPSAAKGRISLRHIMSDENLPGITEVGLIISKS